MNKIHLFSIIIGFLFLLHNISAYPEKFGYVFGLHTKYSEIISQQWRLPTFEETDKFYDPPFFYLVSGLFTNFTSWLSGKDFNSAIRYWQYFSIIFPAASFYFWYQIIKQLKPENKPVHIFFIVGLFSLPVLHKTLVMYTIEPLLFFTVSLTLWYFILFFQPKPTVGKMLILSGFVTINLLTRISAMALLAAVIIGLVGLGWLRQITWWQTIKFLAILLITVFLGTSWFYGREEKMYTDRITIIMNRQKNPIPVSERWSFYTDIPFKFMMTHPVRMEVWLTKLIPIYYSEFWGDWWNYYIQRRFGISLESRRADRLLTTPQRVSSLALQNQVNLIPTLLMVFGFFYLVIKNVKKTFKRPDPLWLAEIMFLVMFIVTWLGFLYSITFHGSPKGDSIKASYMLFILPIFIYLPTSFLFEFLRKYKIIFIPVIIWLTMSTAINLWWSWY